MSTENREKKEQGQEQETYGINFETLTEEAKKSYFKWRNNYYS